MLEADAQGRERRHLLLHAHMFKNAGSSLDESLRRSFGDAFVDHRDDEAMRRGADYLGPYVRRHTGLQALSSHWVTFPLPTLPEIVIHPLLLFRDPLERILSVYRFERRQAGDAPGVAKARQSDFRDYVRWRLSDGVGPVIRNFHTRYCSGDYHGKDLDELYGKARETLDGIPLVGMVHRYEESMVLFEFHLRPIFQNLDLSGTVRNSSDQTLVDYTTRRERALAELGPVLDDVIAANSYDLKLHAAVASRFEKALTAVPGLNERLLELRQRNRAHR